MIRTGYILGRGPDFVWFLALPFFAVAAALMCQEWLPAVAIVSVGLWITIPHHFATWVRAYGLKEDRRRWGGRLIVGPIVIFTIAMLGLKWAPITTLVLAMVWDKQHSLMQQHGFARIYDFKAQTGAPSTPGYDLGLHWVLFVNLFLTSPFFTPMWLRELYRLQIPISAETVLRIQQVSWAVTIAYLLVYVWHLTWSVLSGYRLNPIKYLFILASYFLWYYTAWHTASVLVFIIASRLMHGIQYIVIVYSFTRHKTERSGDQRSVAARLVSPGNLKIFLIAGVFYAVVYQLIIGSPLQEFGFGFIELTSEYPPLPEVGLTQMTSESGYDLFAAAVIETCSLTHYYFDSFIWKVRDTTTQQGL